MRRDKSNLITNNNLPSIDEIDEDKSSEYEGVIPDEIADANITRIHSTKGNNNTAILLNLLTPEAEKKNHVIKATEAKILAPSKHNARNNCCQIS